MSADDRISGLLQDLQQFSSTIKLGQNRIVLLLPPLTARLRFFVHQLINEQFPELHTCSVGEENERRVLVLPRSLPVQIYTGKHAAYHQLSTGSSRWESDKFDIGIYRANRTMAIPLAKGSSGEDWEDLYLDNGEPVDDKTLHAIKQAVGNVKVVQSKVAAPHKTSQQPNTNKEQTLADELLDGYEHVLELSQFASDWTSADLRTALRPLARSDLYETIWVDDTRCLAVFETRAAAERMLLSGAKPCSICGLKKAGDQSREKAETSLPKGASGRTVRPATNASVARRLVTNALGISPVSPETRAKARVEHEKLEKARADKRNKKQAVEDAWNGKVPGT